MEKNLKILKIVIGLLIVIIVLLIGFGVYFVEEFMEEKNEINRYIEENNYNVDDNSSNSGDLDGNISESYMSREKVLKIVLDDVKASQSDVRDVDIELDYKYKQMVYEVTFDYQNFEYEYYINAVDGNVIKKFVERD